MGSPNPSSPSPIRLYIRFSMMLFVFQGTMAAVGFTVPFLQGQGMSATQVGLIMAFNSVVAMVAPPLWGVLADKMRSARHVFVLCLIAASVCYGLTPAASALSNTSVVLLSAMLMLAAFFRAPTGSLMDNWAVTTAMKTPGLDYGKIRIWGSIGYAIISYGLMYVVTWLSLASAFYFYALAALGTLLLCAGAPKEDSHLTVKKGYSFKDLQVGRIFKNYWLCTFILFLTLRGASLYCSNNFLSFLIVDVGGDTAVTGAMNALRACCEVPLLLASRRLIKRFGIVPLLVVSSLLYLIGEMGYAVCTALWHIMAMQALAGIAYGLFVSCQVQYVAAIAPEGLASTAQTMAAALPAVTGIFGNALAGWVMDNIGLRPYFFIAALVLLLSTLLLVGSFPIGTKLLKLKMPDTHLEKNA